MEAAPLLARPPPSLMALNVTARRCVGRFWIASIVTLVVVFVIVGRTNTNVSGADCRRCGTACDDAR
jgi:hypothetical protein